MYTNVTEHAIKFVPIEKLSMFDFNYFGQDTCFMNMTAESRGEKFNEFMRDKPAFFEFDGTLYWSLMLFVRGTEEKLELFSNILTG